MRFIVVTIMIVICGLLFYPLNVLALHHEESRPVAAGKEYPNDEGKVLEILDTTGYTYMELENGDRRFWIAAPTTKVNLGDHIRFVESMSMENFTSKTLNRTFRRVIFVSSTMIKK
ncbi:MAG: hypothetical protein MRK00_16005 [Nitrosomonas sp.]|nr:hypothetical protein [Nitrosomonas sp.]